MDSLIKMQFIKCYFCTSGGDGISKFFLIEKQNLKD